MFLIPLLLTILVIWLIVVLARAASIDPHGREHHTTTLISPQPQVNRPLEILKERYAKGEISEEEYLKVKRNLEH